MKTFIILTVAAAANAGVLLSAGHSTQHRSEDGHGNYAFGYDEKHSTGGSFRQETGSPGVKVGSYGLTDADGRARTVNYVADGAGYRASIATNEPGTAPSLPASAAYNAAPAVAVAAAPTYAAPVAVAAPYAVHAPVVAAPVVARATTYSSAVHHNTVHAAPLGVAAYAAAPVLTKVAAAPAVYAANVFAPSGAVAHGLYGYGYQHAVRAW